MRTRSVQLVTSWWVVGVWAVVTLTTGLVSVVAVLQPAWYVRYSQIRAQDAQGVAFQVMVSSVGPLGYCRLAGVKQMIGFEEERRSSYVESSTVDPATAPSPPWTSGLPPSTTASESPLQTLHEDPSTPPSPTGATHTLPSSAGTQATTLPSEVVQRSSSPEDPGVSGETGVHSDGLSPLEAKDTTTTTVASVDNSVAAEANTSADIPVTTMQSLISDGPSQVHGDKNFKTKESKNSTGIPGTSTENTNARGIEATAPSVGTVGGSSGRKKARKPTRPGNPARGGGGAARRKNATAATRGRRKKGKHRRGKKKNKNRKRPRQGEGAKNTARRGGAPRPDQQLHHLLRSSLGHREAPLALPLQQPRPQDTLGSLDYRPRPPILYCSGVGGGVGSGSSAVWALVGVLYGVAGVVQVVVGVASVALHLPYLKTHARKCLLVAWLGNAQVAVVMAQGVALVLFPLGLGSPLARGECGGSSSVYWPGECTFGWSYMLAVVATTLAAYCPCLARLMVFRKYDYKEWDSINFF